MKATSALTIFLVLFLLPEFMSAKATSIHVKVLSMGDSIPVAYASVFVNGTPYSETDKKGRINIPCKKAVNIKVTHVSFDTYSGTLSCTDDNVTIILKPKILLFDTILVINPPEQHPIDPVPHNYTLHRDIIYRLLDYFPNCSQIPINFDFFDTHNLIHATLSWSTPPPAFSHALILNERSNDITGIDYSENNKDLEPATSLINSFPMASLYDNFGWNEIDHIAFGDALPFKLQDSGVCNLIKSERIDCKIDPYMKSYVVNQNLIAGINGMVLSETNISVGGMSGFQGEISYGHKFSNEISELHNQNNFYTLYANYSNDDNYNLTSLIYYSNSQNSFTGNLDQYFIEPKTEYWDQTSRLIQSDIDRNNFLGIVKGQIFWISNEHTTLSNKTLFLYHNVSSNAQVNNIDLNNSTVAYGTTNEINYTHYFYGANRYFFSSNLSLTYLKNSCNPAANILLNDIAPQFVSSGKVDLTYYSLSIENLLRQDEKRQYILTLGSDFKKFNIGYNLTENNPESMNSTLNYPATLYGQILFTEVLDLFFDEWYVAVNSKYKKPDLNYLFLLTSKNKPVETTYTKIYSAEGGFSSCGDIDRFGNVWRSGSQLKFNTISDIFLPVLSLNDGGDLIIDHYVSSGAETDIELSTAFSVQSCNMLYKYCSMFYFFINYLFTYSRYTNLKITGVNGNQITDYSGNMKIGVPMHTINAGLYFELFDGFCFNGIVNYTGISPVLYDGSLYSGSDVYFNLKSGYIFKEFDDFGLDIFLGISNSGLANTSGLITTDTNIYDNKFTTFITPIYKKLNFFFGINFSYKQKIYF